MEAHLAALQIVVPLVAAPLCLLLRRGWLAWGLALLVSWATLVISGFLLSAVLTRLCRRRPDHTPPIPRSG